MKTLLHCYQRQLFLMSLCLATVTACRPSSDPVNPVSVDFGDKVTRIDTLGHYTEVEARLLLKQAAPTLSFETTTAFSLYRITYKTTSYNQQLVVVSGLLGIPDGQAIKGVVSWQHGTNPTRAESVSGPSPSEGLPISAIFAGNGYVLVAADYIGLGVSTEVPTYLHTQSTVSAVVDLLKISFRVVNQLTGQAQPNLYLTGFSEGGSATAGVQRQLESGNPTSLVLKASAAVAGAYNLRAISVPYALQNNSVVYLGYVANSYALIYKQPLSSVVQPPYAEQLPALFNGSQSEDTIEKALPGKAQDLYTNEEYAALLQGGTNWFTNALEQNQTYQWLPKAPLRLYYGTKDTDVSPEDSKSAYNYMKPKGGNVELIEVGAFDHNETLIRALPGIQQWFNQTK